MEKAVLELDGNRIELPVVTGSNGEKAIDISTLRDTTGYITLDKGFKNTGSTVSTITYIDGEKGILEYRGYPVTELLEHSDFLEVSYLLIYGQLPSASQYQEFSNGIKDVNLIHEKMKKFYEVFSSNTHPMSMLSTMVTGMTGFYLDSYTTSHSKELMDITIKRLLAKIPVIAAWSYKHMKGDPLIYPSSSLSYCDNIQNMLFATPKSEYEIDPLVTEVLNKMFILHADHEQNCSTSAVRLVGSSQVNLYSAVSAGIAALWGKAHGGANQAVIEMLENMIAKGEPLKYWINKAKDDKDEFRLMGFGHRVYKNFDPRAVYIKELCHEVLLKKGIKDPVLEWAVKLEKFALKDPYFKEKKLYPNVDFYSGVIFRALGLPQKMFPVMFVLGRLPGWIAQWKEMVEAKEPIGRPRQIYNGAVSRVYGK